LTRQAIQKGNQANRFYLLQKSWCSNAKVLTGESSKQHGNRKKDQTET